MFKYNCNDVVVIVGLVGEGVFPTKYLNKSGTIVSLGNYANKPDYLVKMGDGNQYMIWEHNLEIMKECFDIPICDESLFAELIN